MLLPGTEVGSQAALPGRHSEVESAWCSLGKPTDAGKPAQFCGALDGGPAKALGFPSPPQEERVRERRPFVLSECEWILASPHGSEAGGTVAQRKNGPLSLTLSPSEGERGHRREGERGPRRRLPGQSLVQLCRPGSRTRLHAADQLAHLAEALLLHELAQTGDHLQGRLRLVEVGRADRPPQSRRP